MVSLTTQGPVVTLHLGDDENRFSPTWIDSVNDHLDQVISSAEPAVLVTTAEGKFYSNGLDLDWLGQNVESYAAYVESVQSLFARVLTLPVPTVAAVNGHAFGAGAMLALAHDYRVMRSDRGYFCLPEVDINIPFTPGMAALIQGKLTPHAAIASMTTGRRFGAADAQELGLVDGSAELEDLHETAAGLVTDLAGKDRPTLGTIKETMFADVVAALRTSAA
jgi:enoyl-CoA hydratase/carnithine racemase